MTDPSVAADEPVLIADVLDMTSGRTDPWVSLPLKKGVDIVDALDWVRAVWPVTVHVDCVGPDELVDRFGPWVDLDKSGVTALDELLDEVPPGDEEWPG